MHIYDPSALTIYIDGSAYNNPGGPGGSAAIVEYPEYLSREREEILAKGYGATKNNRTELMACINALLWARKKAPLDQCSRIVIVTDSLYLSDNWNQAPNWERQRWKNAEGRQILNVDLWKKILSLRRSIRKRIDIEWLRGKSTEVSKRVDALAKTAAKTKAVNVDRGFRGGKTARSKAPYGTRLSECSLGEMERVRIYRYELVGRGEIRVSFDIFSENEKTPSAKCYAFAPTTMRATVHRHRFYRANIVGTKTYPKIDRLEEL